VRRRIRPAGLREGAILEPDRMCDRLAHAAGADREVAHGGVIAHDGLVLHAVHELSADMGVERGDQREPQSREPWREKRNRDHAPAQTALRCVFAHQGAVRDDVGTADLVHPRAFVGQIERRNQIVEHVLDRDRLGGRGDPPWGDHHRQAVDQRSHHLE
jgi:hypothetical protein